MDGISTVRYFVHAYPVFSFRYLRSVVLHVRWENYQYLFIKFLRYCLTDRQRTCENTVRTKQYKNLACRFLALALREDFSRNCYGNKKKRDTHVRSRRLKLVFVVYIDWYLHNLSRDFSRWAEALENSVCWIDTDKSFLLKSLSNRTQANFNVNIYYSRIRTLYTGLGNSLFDCHN